MSIGLSYTSQENEGAPAIEILLTQFTDEDIPRTYQETASFTTSANGASVITGPAFRQKYIWGISVLVTKAQALKIDEIFQSWDSDRANGYTAAVGVTDNTFGAELVTSAIISTPPNFTRLSPDNWIVAFGLTEV